MDDVNILIRNTRRKLALKNRAVNGSVIKGQDGKTPVKGVDYMTQEEINLIKKEATPIKGIHYFDGQNGKPGKDGKTPKKGVDYFTKQDIDSIKKDITPKKGKDYFDGRDGENGSPDTPEEIKQKLESLKGRERLDAKAIKGLDKMVSVSVSSAGGGSGGSYTLPTASPTVLGGVKVGQRLSIDANGVLSADVQTGATGVESVVAGTDIAVDNTDPANPIVSFDGTIPTATSQLTNDSNFITAGDIPAIPEDVSDLTDTTGLLGNATKIQGFDVTTTDPTDGKILVYRTATSEYVLEDKPAAGANPSAADVTFTSGGDVSSTNVQDAIIEVDNEKASKNFAIAMAVAL